MERKHPLAECESCPLYDRGKYVQTTFPDGVNNGMAVVGEAPGRQEVRRKEVFIGVSGQVLNAVLRHHEISRSELVLSNSMACHYPEKDYKNGPPKDAVEACRPRLIGELKDAGVETVITVGAHAAKSLISSKVGITKLRGGGPRKSDYDSDLTVVPTFHPAAALRDQSKFRYIISDIRKVVEWNKEWKEPKFTVVESPAQQAMFCLEELIEYGGNDPLVVDTESGSEKDETFGGGIKEVLCVGIEDEYDDRVLVFPREVMDKPVRDLMAELFVRRGIVAQNGKYDTGRCLNKFLGDVEIPVVFDTMLASYALDESSGVHDLEYMSREYLGAPDWKTEFRNKLETKGDYGSGAADDLYRYNAIDVRNTSLLRDQFVEKLERKGLTDFNEWLLKVADHLVHVEARGLAVDLDYNSWLEEEYDRLVSSIDFGDAENVNPNSPKQITEYLDGLHVSTKSTDKGSLNGLIDRYELLGRDDVVGFCKSLLEHRSVSKMKSTYITGLRKLLVDGVAHPTFLLHGTTTGRLSSRRPNLQNVVRGSKIRRQYVPSKRGRVFVQADYKQSELRCLTYFAKDEFMRDLFNDPSKDVFVDLSQSLHGSAYDEAGSSEKKEMRVLTKTFAYGVSYGREARSVANAFGLSIREARRMMNDFYAMIPDIMEYQKSIKEKVLAKEDLVNMFGRHRRFYLITDMNVKDVMNEAMAYMPQSTSSDICLEAFTKLDDEGFDIRNLVHDSIMAECDEADAARVGARMRRVMIDTAEELTEGYVRFDADVEVGQSWGDLHPA